MSTSSQTPVTGTDLGGLLQSSFNYLFAQIGQYILISLISLIPFFVLTVIFFLAFGLGGLGLAGGLDFGALLGIGAFAMLLIFALAIVTAALMSGALIQAANSQAAGGKVSVGDAYKAAFAKFGPLIVVYLVVGIAVGIGSILLVLPGLVAFFFLCLAPMAVMIDNAGIGDALGRSCRFALKVPAEIIVVLVIAFVASFILSFIPFIGWLANCLVSPWAFIALTLAYKKAQSLA